MKGQNRRPRLRRGLKNAKDRPSELPAAAGTASSSSAVDDVTPPSDGRAENQSGVVESPLDRHTRVPKLYGFRGLIPVALADIIDDSSGQLLSECKSSTFIVFADDS
jgi:hypothetical protein